MNTLEISTTNARTEHSNRLMQTFRNPINLQGYISLSDITLWYNWKNIRAGLQNNTFTYKKGSTPYPVTIPDGSYSVRTISDFIHHTMKNNGHVDNTSTDNKQYGINLFSNAAYNRVSYKVKSEFELSFGEGLAKVLGATPDTIYRGSGNFPNVPQIENVKSVQVHCSLVYNEYQSDSSLLYNFTPKSSYGSLLSVEPRFPQWRQTRVSTENTIEVWLTDQDGTALDIEDDWGVVLQIAEKELIRV